jgi:hypothetical protein
VPRDVLRMVGGDEQGLPGGIRSGVRVAIKISLADGGDRTPKVDGGAVLCVPGADARVGLRLNVTEIVQVRLDLPVRSVQLHVQHRQSPSNHHRWGRIDSHRQLGE